MSNPTATLQPVATLPTMTTTPPVDPPYISSCTPQPVRVEHTHADGSKEHKVLVLGTGGTIASEPTSEGYKPISELWARNVFFKRIRQHPQLSDAPPASFNSEVVSTPVGKNLRYPPLRTPPLDEHDNTVVYEILDLENHMDSSEMQPSGGYDEGTELMSRLEQDRRADPRELGRIRGVRGPLGHRHARVHFVHLDVLVRRSGKAHRRHGCADPAA